MEELKMESHGRKIRNPLMKRIPRELSGDWRKYLVVSLFLILTIGFVSGMYVANESMMTSVDKGVREYRLESGHFELGREADEELLSGIASGEMADIKQYYLDSAREELDEKFQAEFGSTFQPAYEEAYQQAYEEAWKKVQDEIEEKYADAEEKYGLGDSDFRPVPVEVYENFYRNEEEDNDNDGVADGTVRVYVKTEEVNLACLMDGDFPATEEEIAIDRMHADNAGIKVGDTISVSGQSFRVVGLIAYVNYSTLREKNTDLIFDALKFDVAMVTESGFRRLGKTVHYAYAWQYAEEPADVKEEKRLSDNFLKALLTQTVAADNEIEDYLPGYANQAVHFATEDMGSDEAMGGVLLDILIVIIAFIFAITISNTIVKESQTIGTLRASGYSRGELVTHYLAMPVIVTLIVAGMEGDYAGIQRMVCVCHRAGGIFENVYVCADWVFDRHGVRFQEDTEDSHGGSAEECGVGGRHWAEPPQNLPIAAKVVQIAFPYWLWYNFPSTYQQIGIVRPDAEPMKF